ncbi:MAG: hypothetical protein HZB33_09380 [Nitrospirae bacterium]|nr:hypothetical protein [Nitrospirota bacterium]
MLDNRMIEKEPSSQWVEMSRTVNGPLFSELDVLLRALDRYFNTDELTSSHPDIATRNFYDELTIIRDGIIRVLGILDAVIPERKKNSYWFQKFAESKLLSTRDRDVFREKLYRQDTPEKGLYLLYDSFINLKGVISDITRTGTIAYIGFMNIGHMIGKEIRENRYFNPFLKDPNPEFDVISNAEISEIVKNLKARETRKNISIILIYLFRILRFLGFVDMESRRAVSLNSSLLILMLLKTEIGTFQIFCGAVINKTKDPELQMLLKSLAYQFTMETRRVYLQELRDINRKKATPDFRGKLENSHGILKNLTEQSIVQIAGHFRPGITGEELFPSFVTRQQQSLRLREDVFVFHKLLGIFAARASKAETRLAVFGSLKNYMTYFESFTFRLLRHDDYEEFEIFFRFVNSLRPESLKGDGLKKLIEKISYFRIYLETTLRQIENRSELAGRKLDERVENLLRQYL